MGRKPSGARPSRWSHVPAAVMWTTTVAASVAAILVAMRELGVFAHEPAAAAVHADAGTPAPAPAPVEVRRPVVVQIELPDGGTRSGFFTPRGQLVAPATAAGGVATWDAGPEHVRASLELVLARDALALFLPVGRTGPAFGYPTRDATDLRAGDLLVVHLGRSQRTGRVIEIRSGRVQALRTSHVRVLVTTLAPTEPGAPVLDDQGRLIGMIAGEDEGATIAVPVEDLRAQFPEAW